MGKTEKGAVWLSADRTSPFEFYQYFINVADADVLMTLRFLSDVTEEQYRDLELSLRDKPHERAAQNFLAQSLTRLVHGEEKLQAVQHATKLLFGAELTSLTQNQLNAIFQNVPSQEVPRQRLVDGLGIIDALCLASLATSKSEARRSVTEGAANVNNSKVTTPDRILNEADLAGDYLILRIGKKRYGLLRFA